MSLPQRLRDLLAGLPRFLLLLLRLAGDSRVSGVDRALLLGATLYALTPLDLIPDFLPLIGQIDDLYLLALSIDRLIRNAGHDLVRAHWDGPEELLSGLCGSIEQLAAYLPGPIRRRLKSRTAGR